MHSHSRTYIWNLTNTNYNSKNDQFKYKKKKTHKKKNKFNYYEVRNATIMFLFWMEMNWQYREISALLVFFFSPFVQQELDLQIHFFCSIFHRAIKLERSSPSYYWRLATKFLNHFSFSSVNFKKHSVKVHDQK